MLTKTVFICALLAVLTLSGLSSTLGNLAVEPTVADPVDEILEEHVGVAEVAEVAQHFENEENEESFGEVNEQTEVMPEVKDHPGLGQTLDYDGDQYDDEEELEAEAMLTEATELLFNPLNASSIPTAIALLEAQWAELDARLPPAVRARKRFTHQRPKDFLSYFDQRPPQSSALPPADSKLEEMYVDDGGYTVPYYPGQRSHSSATFMLAVLLSSGIVSDWLPRNESRAVFMLHRASLTGSREAEMALAHRYFYGYGVPKNMLEGLRRAKIIADQLATEADEGNTPLIMRTPVNLRQRFRDAAYHTDEGWDSVEQVEHELELAAQDQVEFVRRIGYRRLIGYGLERDPRLALQNFRRAERLGDHYALFHMAFMYMRGVGVQQNYRQALELFERAAAHGVKEAYNGLGALYFNGQGVPENLTQAFLYFQSGTEQEDPECMFNLATLYYSGFGVEQNYTKAAELFQAALALKQWRAPYALAILHETGQGVEYNITRAYELLQMFLEDRSHWSDSLVHATDATDDGQDWYALVEYAMLAEQGCRIAASNFAWLLQSSDVYKGVDRNDMLLDALLDLAHTGDANGWVDAGNLVAQGGLLGSEQASPNLSLAHEYYTQAAEAGNVEGMCLVGWSYVKGAGTDGRSLDTAAGWYRTALRTARESQDLSYAYAVAPALALGLVRMLQWLESSGPPFLVTLVIEGMSLMSDIAPRLHWPEQLNTLDADSILILLLLLLLTLVLMRRRWLRRRGPETLFLLQ